MPTLTRWSIKTALAWAACATIIGVLLVWPGSPALPYPTYLHLLTVGWLSNLIFGVAHWMFPRASVEQPRGDVCLAWAAWGITLAPRHDLFGALLALCFAGFVVAYGYWISILAGNAAIAIASISYLSILFPALATVHHLDTVARIITTQNKPVFHLNDVTEDVADVIDEAGDRYTVRLPRKTGDIYEVGLVVKLA